MDPQQRLLLERGYVAAHGASRRRAGLAGGDAAVLVGIERPDWALAAPPSARRSADASQPRGPSVAWPQSYAGCPPPPPSESDRRRPLPSLRALFACPPTLQVVCRRLQHQQSALQGVEPAVCLLQATHALSHFLTRGSSPRALGLAPADHPGRVPLELFELRSLVAGSWGCGRAGHRPGGTRGEGARVHSRIALADERDGLLRRLKLGECVTKKGLVRHVIRLGRRHVRPRAARVRVAAGPAARRGRPVDGRSAAPVGLVGSRRGARDTTRGQVANRPSRVSALWKVRGQPGVIASQCTLP